jgi:hypothetical protein
VDWTPPARRDATPFWPPRPAAPCSPGVAVVEGAGGARVSSRACQRGGVGTGNVGWGRRRRRREAMMIRRDGTRRNGLRRLAWRDGDADGGRPPSPIPARPRRHVTWAGPRGRRWRVGSLAFAPVRRTELATRTGPRMGRGRYVRPWCDVSRLHGAAGRRGPAGPPAPLILQ